MWGLLYRILVAILRSRHPQPPAQSPLIVRGEVLGGLLGPYPDQIRSLRTPPGPRLLPWS